MAGHSCVNCHQDLNVVTGEIPFTVHDDDGTGVGKAETWCPQCFVHCRAPQEPHRFHGHEPHRRGKHGYRAVACTNPNCRLITVDPGLGLCAQCGCRSVLELPPKQLLVSA